MSDCSVASLKQHLGRLSEGLPAPFWALWVGTLITKAGSFVVPMMFIYLTQERGLSLTTAGAVAALYGLGSLLGSLLGGVLADAIGRRRTMLLALMLGASFMVLLGLSTSLEFLGAIAFLLGLTQDMYRPASQALVADLVEPQHRLKAFGLQYWAINLGFSVALLIAGHVAKRSFLVLFLGDALTTLILAGIIAARVPESRPPAVAFEKMSGSFITPFLDPPYAFFLALNFAVVLIFFQHLTALPEDMHRKGLGTEIYGTAVATNGVLIVLLQPFITRKLTGIRRSRLLAAGAALTGVGFGLTTLAASLPAYVLTVAVWTLGEIIFAPVNAALVADLSPPQLRGRYQGAFSITWGMGAMAAPVIGPWLIERASLQTLWFACLALGLLAAALQLSFSSRLGLDSPRR